MRIPYKNKLLVAMLFGILVYVVGCVGTSVQTIPESINYTSQLKVVNLVSGGGTATISLNNQSLGSLDFGAELPNAQAAFLNIPSGNKVLNVTFTGGTAKEYRFAADTEYKLRVFLVGTPADAQVIKVLQRYTWQTKDSPNGALLFPADTGFVSFFNGSTDATINGVTINDTLDIEFASPLALGGVSGRTKLKAGNYSFKVAYNDSLETSFDYTVGAKSRYTVVIYDTVGSIKNSVLVDD